MTDPNSLDAPTSARSETQSTPTPSGEDRAVVGHSRIDERDRGNGGVRPELTLPEHEAITLEQPHLTHEFALAEDDPKISSPASRLRAFVDPISSFRHPTKSPGAWLGTAIRLFILLLVGGLVVLVTHEWNWWVASAVQQSTDDAYLQADMTPLAAKVAGYVRSVPVRDFQNVKKGDLLVEIVDDDYRGPLEQAEANVAGAEAAIENIEQQKLLQDALIKQAEATIRATEADLTRYHLEAVRQQTLLANRLAGTPQLTEQAIANEKRTEATLELNRAQLNQQRQQFNVLDSQRKQAQATLKAQQAARDLAKLNLGYTRITSPADGMVGQRQVRPGQYVNVGTQVISVVPLPNVWVVANYKETQMTRIRVGQPARVTVDAFPRTVLHGHVDSWSPASGAQFSLLPPDNATGNFTKVVQRIPVKIVLDPDPALDELLRPGMSVVATIDTSSTAPELNVGVPIATR